MIKKILSAGAVLASAAFLVPQASAQTVSPTGPFTLTNVGTISVTKGITLSCGLTGSGNVSSSGAASVTSINLTGGLCGSIVFSGTPYAVTSTSTSSITINGVVVTAITGNCAGNLTGSFNQATGEITFANATLPSTSGGNPCSITGKVKTTPALSFTIP
ncbi:hypothetical protein ACMGDH_10795 [Sphingomonas sp. DT-207]|uniref:hypothetical protein n=1 Tax=Sphingomonas sp. DT-207 TaxID=3396167 RepID=UPI003F1B909D